MIVWSVVWMIVILLIAVSYVIYLVLNFDSNMLIVGLVETGPNTFQLQLSGNRGGYQNTLSKNDRNLCTLLLRMILITPMGVPLATLASLALCNTV